jgi:hypothetical protein
VATHVKIIAVLFIVGGVLLLIGAFFTPLILGALAAVVGSTDDEGAAVGAAVLGFTGIALSVILGLLALPNLICGWGLLKFRGWARILGIILAAIALTKFPIGTAFGVYALVILFRKETEALFEPAVVPRP